MVPKMLGFTSPDLVLFHIKIVTMIKLPNFLSCSKLVNASDRIVLPLENKKPSFSQINSDDSKILK